MITEPDHFSIFKEDWKSWVQHSNFDFILNVNSLKTVTVVYFNFPNFPQYLITCTLEQRQPTTKSIPVGCIPPALKPYVLRAEEGWVGPEMNKLETIRLNECRER